MHTLLTGGYGCIGCWIAKNLVERGETVWVYDLKQDLRRMRQVMDEPLVEQVRFVQGDVTDLAGLRALAKHAITQVVHLAGLQVPVCRADPLLGPPSVPHLPEQVRIRPSLFRVHVPFARALSAPPAAEWPATGMETVHRQRGGVSTVFFKRRRGE